MNKLIAGVAVIALSASLAQAQPGEGNRDNRGNERAQQAQQRAQQSQQRAQNQQRAQQARERTQQARQRTQEVRQQAQQRNDQARQRAEASRQRAQEARQRESAQQRQAQAARERASENRQRTVVARERAQDQRERIADQRRAEARRIAERRADARRLAERREDIRDRQRDRAERAQDRRQYVREARRDANRFRVIRNQADLRRVTYRDYRLIDGCPPGLARRNNGCIPPGLARARYNNYRDDYYRPAYFGYDRFDSGRYWYDDGYLYRLDNRNSIAGYIPLLGGALSVGQVWPSYYEPAPLSPYYTEYYNLGDPYGYRYADDVIYRVDSGNSAITAIVALLTGDQFGIGQPMPAGYDVYNVPYDYRDTYYDTPDAYYRYSDGYIYEADPETQLITAAIELLV